MIKGISIVIGFLMVPLTLEYVQKEQYGIWLTLASIVAWFSFFDIGMGHGLRNKLAEALAKSDLEKARILVSSTYAILGSIFLGLLLLFFVVQPLLNWQLILNTETVSADELRLIAIVTFTFFSINFVLRLLHSIFLAHQQPANQGLVNLLGNLVALLVIFVLTKTTQGSLFYLALTLGLAPLVILVIASVFMFRGQYRSLAPSIHHVKVDHFKELITLGFRFFLIQVSSIIIFSTDNIIITQILGPGEVPAYAVAHKYFGLITAVFAIISVPFWSAYTEAYVKRDMKWILATNKKLIKIWGILVFISIIMLAAASPFYSFWVPGIEVPLLLSIMMCVYVTVLAWGNIFVVFVNGVGKIQLQLILGVVGAIINIPLSIFLARNLEFGVAGIIMASIICIGYGPILAPIQFKKITRGTATGIWNR